MNTRSVAEWKEVLGRLPSPEGTPVERVVADRVLGDLAGYRHSSRYRVRDAEELANAMTAWAEMNAAAGLYPDPDGRTYHAVPAEVPAFFRDGRDMAGNDV